MSVAENLKAWDDYVEKLRQALWRVHGEPSARIKDSRGRTMVDDLDDHILTAAISAELDELRKEARAKEADEAAVRDVIGRSELIVRTQAASFGVIAWYWGAFLATRHHQHILEPWLANAPQAERDAIQVHVADVEKELLEELNAWLARPSIDSPAAIMRIRDVLWAATKFYNERRLALVKQQLANVAAGVPKSRKRQSACPQPVAVPETRTRPALAPGNVALEKVYPPIAKSMGVEGPVTMRLHISATGCMEQGDVVQTSGADDLDDAALLWAETATYLPAAKGRKGVAESFLFRVVFMIKEEPEFPLLIGGGG